MAEKKDDCVESPISPCTVEEKAGDGNEEVQSCLEEVSSSSSSSSTDKLPDFAYPASWESVGLESPLGEESAEEEGGGSRRAGGGSSGGGRGRSG